MTLDSLNSILSQTRVENETALVLGLLFLSFMLLALWRLGAGDAPDLRPIAGFVAVTGAVEDATESGRPIHVAPGAGTLGDALTVQTLAGLDLVDGLAQPAATSGARLVVSTASPLLLPLVEGLHREAFAAAGYPGEYRPGQTRFLADNRNAFALAFAAEALRERAGLSVLAGDLADEYLLAAEPTALAGAELVAGAANVRTLPFVVATADHSLIGEELFAAGAYVSRKASGIASLLAQDQVRLLLVGMILAGVALESLGGG